MGKIKRYIQQIVDNGKQEDMECLSDMLDKLIIDMKVNNPTKYKEYKSKLFGMAYNQTFDKELAKEIVEDMRPLGEYWNMDQVEMVMKQNGITNIKVCDMYLVMNSLANDYNEIIPLDETDTYIKMAKAFIKDEDAIENKVWKYFTEIPRED